MLKKLLSISFILFWAFIAKAQNNHIAVTSGISFRISNNPIFGYETALGRHSDRPSIVFGVGYGRQVYELKNGSSFSANVGYNSIGVIGKKIHFPENSNPTWGGAGVSDEYYRNYELRLQNLELGLAYLFKHSAKLNFTASITGNYLFRVNNKIITEYPNSDEFRNFSKFKSVGSIVPDSSFNRTTLSASAGIEYQILNPSNFIVVELGSYITNLKNEKSKVFPIWLDLGYRYKF